MVWIHSLVTEVLLAEWDFPISPFLLQHLSCQWQVLQMLWNSMKCWGFFLAWTESPALSPMIPIGYQTIAFINGTFCCHLKALFPSQKKIKECFIISPYSERKIWAIWSSCIDMPCWDISISVHDWYIRWFKTCFLHCMLSWVASF